jgi:hypothetical protein
MEGKRRSGRRDIRTRQHLMERSFARAKRYGFDRARWRGLWRMEIQELMTCIVQNIQVLVNKAQKPPKAVAQKAACRAQSADSSATRRSRWIYEQIEDFIWVKISASLISNGMTQ